MSFYSQAKSIVQKEIWSENEEGEDNSGPYRNKVD